MSAPPTIDGNVDPAEWKEASHVRGFIDPVTGKPTADVTEAWIGFDRQAIYVAFICHDAQPGGIVGREIHPGADFEGEDTVTFRINPFGTRAWDGRSRFTVNVLNTQNEEISGGRAAKREWRGEWTSATRRLPEGWSAEMRIPWKALNYPGGKGRSMDINLERFQARTRVGSEWANTTVAGRPEFSGFWEAVDPPPQDQKRRLQFLAYAAPEYGDGKLSLHEGLDVRYAVTPTITALASLSPDFRNIENQVAGVDFTRTERFLGETRPFFNEGGDFFSLSDGYSFGTMFYSQRIPTFDVGAKAFGRITPTFSAGALTTVQFGGQAASVARVQKSFGPKASMSAYTESYSDGPLENQAAGLNGSVRRGSFNADFQLATEHGRGERPDTAGAYSIAYDVPRWFSIFRKEWIQPDFAPPLAYIPWTDRRGWYNYTEYFTDYRTGPFRSIDWNVSTTDFRTYDGKLQQRGTDIFASVTTRKDVQFSLNRTNTKYADGLDSVTGIGVTFNSSNRFKRFGGYFETGERASKPSNFLDLFSSFRVLRRLDLGFEYSALRFDGTDTLAIVTLGSELSRTRSITGRFVQRNGKQNAYLAFRNGGLSGTEYYFILGDPNADTFQRRISVKVVWAF